MASIDRPLRLTKDGKLLLDSEGKLADLKCCCGCFMTHFRFAYDLVANSIFFSYNGGTFGPYSETRHVEYYWNLVPSDQVPGPNQFRYRPDFGPNEFEAWSVYGGSGTPITGNHFQVFEGVDATTANDIYIVNDTDTFYPDFPGDGCSSIIWLSQNVVGPITPIDPPGFDPAGTNFAGDDFHFGHWWSYLIPDLEVPNLPLQSVTLPTRVGDFQQLGTSGFSGSITFQNITIEVS